jgi:hypothetical protein
MPDSTFLTCRVHTVDRIEYTLSVYEAATGYIGFWGCGQCRDEGGIEKRLPSREDALSRCYQAIDRHHAECHERSAAVPPVGGT